MIYGESFGDVQDYMCVFWRLTDWSKPKMASFSTLEAIQAVNERQACRSAPDSHVYWKVDCARSKKCLTSKQCETEYS